MISLTKLKELVSGTKLLKEMRKRTKERSDRLSLSHERNLKEFDQFECLNDTKLSGGIVYENLVSIQNEMRNVNL